MPGTFDFNYKLNQIVQDYTEASVNLGVVGAAVTISFNAGTFLLATLTSGISTTFTMPPAIAGKSFTMLLRQPNATTFGSATFTNVKWRYALAPTVTAGSGALDIFAFMSDGVNWYGNSVQSFTPTGADRAIFGYGYTSAVVSMTNLVSNTGVVSTDVTGVGTARYYLAAAGL